MVLFRVQIRVGLPQRDQVLGSLKQTVWHTQAMPGCISARLCVDADEESVLVLIEEWQTWEHLEARLRADSLRVVLAAIDCSVEPPEVRLDNISGTKGLEFVVACRSGQAPG